MSFYVVAAVLLMVSLLTYAIYLHYLLRREGSRQEGLRIALAEHAQQQRQEVNNSIQILARGCQQGQLSLTETSIRIRGLLNALSLDIAVLEEFSAFAQLADAASHIPILEEWKSLSGAKKKTFDQEREQLEGLHSEFVLSAANRIINRKF